MAKKRVVEDNSQVEIWKIKRQICEETLFVIFILGFLSLVTYLMSIPVSGEVCMAGDIDGLNVPFDKSIGRNFAVYGDASGRICIKGQIPVVSFMALVNSR